MLTDRKKGARRGAGGVPRTRVMSGLAAVERTARAASRGGGGGGLPLSASFNSCGRIDMQPRPPNHGVPKVLRNQAMANVIFRMLRVGLGIELDSCDHNLQ